MTAQGNGVTERLVDYTLGLSYESIPPKVLERTKQLFLDFLGVALGGRVFGEFSVPVLQGVKDLSNERQGPCTVVGEVGKIPSHFAALLNAAFAHGMDLDAPHRDGGMHPGAPVFSTLMAVAEEKGVTGREFLTAVVAAYDVVVKIGRAVVEDGTAQRGFEASATQGIFGATAGGARLMSLNRDETLNALGINVCQAAGSGQFLEGGGWNKPLHIGLAAHNSIYALAMARHGFKGAVRPLEGRFGYFFSYTSDGWDPTKITGLGTDFEVMGTAIKPYPTCRLNHASIEACVGLVKEHQLAPGDIASLDVYISPFGHNMVAEPSDLKRTPTSLAEGIYSLYFASAVAVVDGDFTWESYGKLRDPRVKALMAATTSHPTEGMRKNACRLTITTRDGHKVNKEVILPKGEPENPLTWEEGIAKFTSLAEESLGHSGAQRVVQAAGELEHVGDLSQFTALLRP